MSWHFSKRERRGRSDWEENRDLVIRFGEERGIMSLLEKTGVDLENPPRITVGEI